MDKIVTGKEKIFDVDFLATIPEPERCYIRLLNTDLVTVATVFGDPEETQKIIYGSDVVEGFKTLLSINPEGDAIKVSLKR